MNKKEVAAVVSAWTNAGPVPAFHLKHQTRLRREWPTLANAIDDLVNATTRQSKEKPQYE